MFLFIFQRIYRLIVGTISIIVICKYSQFSGNEVVPAAPGDEKKEKKPEDDVPQISIGQMVNKKYLN